MSDTPLTDAQVRSWIGYWSQQQPPPPSPKGWDEFARQLERELNAKDQQLSALRLVCGTTDAKKFETALDRASARIAELDKDKARLDWLDHNAVIRNRWLVLMERDENEEETLRWAGVEWAGVAPEDVRSSIDDAMRGIQP
jgi:hypothetical protein